MPTSTGRTGMLKPGYGDQADIAVLDSDLDVIDAEIGTPSVAVSSPLPSVPYDGMLRFDKNDGYIKRWDSAKAAWIKVVPNMAAGAQGQSPILGSWTTVAPTLSNITLGTGGTPVNQLQYIRLPGNLIFWKHFLRFGTSGFAISGGNASFTFPGAFPVDLSSNLFNYNVGDTIGVGEYHKTGGGSRVALVVGLLTVGPPGNVYWLTTNASGAPVNGTNPYAPAAADEITSWGMYVTSAA